MEKNFYDILWVSKSASNDEIKKAYRKLAMQYHPDRNKWNKEAESKFKEINKAYETLSDESKKKQYDMFWSSSNPFGSAWSYSSSWFGWFEDIFSNFSQWWRSQSQGFDFSDLFWNFSNQSSKSYSQKREEPKKESPDIEKTYEIPVFDLILGCKIEVEWFLWQKAKLKIPANTKPWTKFRVKDFWKKISWVNWSLIVIVDVRMPKEISDIDKSLLENIRENIIY